MKILAIILAVAMLLFAQSSASSSVIGPYSTAVNIALDLAGKPDPVHGGASDGYASRVEFHPPSGYRTRVLRVYGDFIAWPRYGVIRQGTTVETGWGLKTTAPDGSQRVTYPGYTATPYDNSFVWLQGVITPSEASSRLAFDHDTRAGGLLGPDNIMLSQSFVALNDTGLTIHMEPTFVVVYQFEKL